MAATLFGLLVLNPRTPEQAVPWSAALQGLGAEVIELPLLELRPRQLTHADKDKLLMLDRYDACLFVSANAAKYGLHAVADYWPQWPWNLPAFAVGDATAAPLLDAALTVLTPDRADSEGLLAMSELQADQVAGKRFLVFRGGQGRELLIQTLRERGATVDVLALYDVEMPAQAQQQWQALVRKPDVVLLTSPLVWQHWQTLAGAYALTPTLVVSSERLAERIKVLGAQNVHVVQGASLQQWLAALGR